MARIRSKFRGRNLTPGNIIFTTLNTIFLILTGLIMLYPYLNTIAVSLNEGYDTLRGGIHFWPRVFTWQNYEAVFAMGSIRTAFTVSVARTVIGASLSVITTAMLAYTLSRKDYIFRKFITIIFVMTMYFNAGMIPNYFLIRNLNLMNTFAVYIIPSMVSAFNVIVIRTYMSSLPESLVESARIDGAGDFTVFFRIKFPLSKPVLATVALFCAVGAWNSWFDNYIYNSGSAHLVTLQLELMKLVNSTTSLGQSSSAIHGAGVNENTAAGMVTPKSIRSAITVVASLPILMVYPFLQKYFVTGLTIGSVKG